MAGEPAGGEDKNKKEEGEQDSSSPPPLDLHGNPFCQDSRWREFVERVGEENKLLGARLRAAEVSVIAADVVEIIPASKGEEWGRAEENLTAPHLNEQFGPAFHMRLNNDKTGKARPEFSIAGRNRMEEEARLAARRSEAESNSTVQNLLRVFPKGKVVEVALSDLPKPNRRDDV